MKKLESHPATSFLWNLLPIGLLVMSLELFTPGIVHAQPIQVAASATQAQPSPTPATDSEEQYERLAAAFQKHSYSIAMTEAGLSGPGADFLKQKAASAQFVLLGEEHNVKEVPDFTARLFAMLHQCCEFNHLALENDPVSAQAASMPPLKGNLGQLTQYASKFPNAFTFLTRQELQMIADVGKLATTKTDPVWGLDQSFGVLHALEELRTLPGINGRSSAFQELAEQARALDSSRFTEGHHYMTMAKVSDLENLRKEVAPKPGSEADFILGNLVSSARIYTNYRGEYTGYASAFEREEQMKRLFMRGYRSAQKSGEAEPRVLLKMGHWHIFRGLGPSALQTLGDFVTEFALANGEDALSIAIFIHGSPNKWREVGEWQGMRPFGMAASADHWMLIDFRPIREEIFAHEFGPLSPTMRSYIFGFDAALIIANASPADAVTASGGTRTSAK